MLSSHAMVGIAEPSVGGAKVPAAWRESFVPTNAEQMSGLVDCRPTADGPMRDIGGWTDAALPQMYRCAPAAEVPMRMVRRLSPCRLTGVLLRPKGGFS
jgi:hypothetical protein